MSLEANIPSETKLEQRPPYCYCQSDDRDQYMLECQKCKNLFHFGCLKKCKPTTLEGDVFFMFTCVNCNEMPDEEECVRMKLQWLQVVMLTLYNLQLSGNGKCGYFRWKEHICAYIDKYWTLFFGYSRKKTATWTGTVAGTLSAGCPQYFSSGVQQLKEPGWWRLTNNKPPTLEMIAANNKPSKRHKPEVKDTTNKVEGLRARRSKTSFAAAMELKAKRSTTQEAKEIRKAKTTVHGDGPGLVDILLDNEHKPPAQVVQLTQQALKQQNIEMNDIVDQSSQMSYASSKSDMYLTAKDLMAGEQLPELLLMDDKQEDSDSDFEVDPCSFTPPETPSSPLHLTGNTQSLPTMEDILSTLDEKANEIQIKKEPITDGYNEAVEFKVEIKEEPMDITVSDHMDTSANQSVHSILDKNGDDELSGPSSESESESDDNCDQMSEVTETSDKSSDANAAKKRKTESDESANKPEPVYVPLTVYEESQLLNRLNSMLDAVEKDPEANRLRRKLLLRKVKRERGLPILDLDAHMYKLVGRNNSYNKLNKYNLPSCRFGHGDYRVLDRFHMNSQSVKANYQSSVLFLNRLVGTEDDQLQSISSPYTSRMLKPFIRRDYESQPLKVKLLEEIKAYPHRNDPSWKAPPMASVDYCYVRPQHIPSVNTLCKEFFWPGIDLSECLQYPDFSCIVLYRKIVIAFAFMVPDVKFNEAYISFIFTHPEWRGAGIGTFMLYHLIQTCMGKDVTLHVSATNPAMILYQKFGFKPEEFILDFYDKYFPVNSKECKHAFFLRLRR